MLLGNLHGSGVAVCGGNLGGELGELVPAVVLHGGLHGHGVHRVASAVGGVGASIAGSALGGGLARSLRGRLGRTVHGANGHHANYGNDHNRRNGGNRAARNPRLGRGGNRRALGSGHPELRGCIGVDRHGRLLGFGREGPLGRKAVSFRSGGMLGCGRRALGLATLSLLALGLGALLSGLLAAALLLLALAAAGVARLLLGRKVGPGIGCGILVPGCLVRRESRLILALLARKLRVGRGRNLRRKSCQRRGPLGLARPWLGGREARARLIGPRRPHGARHCARRGSHGHKGNGTCRERLLKRLGRGNGLAGGRSRRGIGTHRRPALLAEARLVRDFCPTVVALHSGPPAPSCQLLPIILETPRRAKYSKRGLLAKSN